MPAKSDKPVPNHPSIKITILLLALLLSPGLNAASMPEPLTLKAALDSAANPSHYSLLDINQKILGAEAQAGITLGQQGFRLDLKSRIRQVGKSASVGGGTTGDSAASLVLSRPIYDFGLHSAEQNQLMTILQALEFERQYLIEQRRLSILQKYFAVLNADNDFITANEALAIGFIRFDRAEEKQALGLVASIEVVRLQSVYEKIRQQLLQAENRQRLTRAILADEMGFPDQLPRDLEIPLITTERPVPESLDGLYQQALKHSLPANLVKLQSNIAHDDIRIGEAQDNPSIDFELQASSYERDSSLRDEWRASVYLDIPLYTQSSSSRIDLGKARYQQALSQQQRVHSNLRLQILELLQIIQQQQLTVGGNRIEQNYREMYLDRSRAEYELEYNTDLGDSMIEFSRSNASRLESLYAYELAYQKLLSLVGSDYLQTTNASQ